jgi:hypothetical protein
MEGGGRGLHSDGTWKVRTTQQGNVEGEVYTAMERGRRGLYSDGMWKERATQR